MSSARQTNWLNVLFRTRVKVCHQQTTILNLSLLFSVLAVFTAPQLAAVGLLIALLLGYRFSIEKSDPPSNSAL